MAENPVERDWKYWLETGFEMMLKDESIVGPNRKDLKDHLSGTPKRIVKSFANDFFTGALIDPKSVLTTAFSNKKYDEVVIVSNINFTSFCMHHALPFLGQVHFGYLPADRIVGLSKIPRLVRILSRRLQVQENLTEEIVDEFQDAVKPRGCGVIIEAMHTCMSVRGVEQEGSITETTALRGEFKTSSLKAEFLAQVAPRKGKL